MVSNKEKRSELISKILALQLCQTPEIFKSASNLFVYEQMTVDLEAEDEVNVFITYFRSEWLGENSNWFEGFNHPHHLGAHSTNNGSESINATIKKFHTLRKRLNMPTFLSCAMQMAGKWSIGIDNSKTNHKVFATSPTISLAQWTAGYEHKSTNQFKRYLSDLIAPFKFVCLF